MANALLRWPVCALALFALLQSCHALADAGRDYQPFAGRSGEFETFASYERKAYYVPAADGVRLALTVYLPTDGPDVDRFPVLLWYLPGHRESINPETGEITSAYSAEDLAFFTAHGYALAAAEMRGSGASFGTRELDRGPQIGRDGKAIVDWIARQDWSDGSVGMVGLSYQGFSQYATAAEQPEALKAIFPEIAGFDDYTSMFYPGGIQLLALSQLASGAIVRDDLNHFDLSGRRPRLPSVPVIDEDGDGELADEIPVDKDGDGDFLDDGPPTYRDASSRMHIYYLATKYHLDNTNLTVESLAAAPHRDSRLAGTAYTYADLDPGDKPARIAEAGIATYHRGGWYDYHARDTVMWHATLDGHSPTRLLMAPTGHGGFPADGSASDYSAGPYFRHFGDRETTRADLNREKLRFFDYYLRGLDNGFDKEPPVLLYVMGEGWRAEAAWPLARRRETTWYFAAGQALAPEPGLQGVDEYAVDLDADARSEGAHRFNFMVSFAEAVLQLGSDSGRRLHYTSQPLAADMEVTGHPLVTLDLSSSAAAGDVFVYLEDVGPDGDALLVTEGQLRANYVEPRPIQEMSGFASPAIAPQLPWHGFDSTDYVREPFADGRVVTLTFDLLPTSWVFRAGHRLRVSVAGADQPVFALHPALAEEENPPVYRIHRGRGSKIMLPVIPRSK